MVSAASVANQGRKMTAWRQLAVLTSQLLIEIMSNPLREESSSRTGNQEWPFSRSGYVWRLPEVPQPEDARQIRISRTAFRAFMSRYDVPTSFVAAISRMYQTRGSGFREHSISNKSGSIWEHWCAASLCGDQLQ
jgi:hypothetical protein